jgi:hypothetical protein
MRISQLLGYLIFRLSVCGVLTITGCTGGSVADIDNAFGSKESTSPTTGNSGFSFTPQTFNFGIVNIGQSLSTTIQITNSTSSPLIIAKVAGKGTNFVIESDDCPRTPTSIAPNGSCQATILFSPTTAGEKVFNFTIDYSTASDSATPLMTSIQLLGTGYSPVIFAGISSVDNITTKKARLNWTNVSNVSAYYAFSIASDGSKYFLGLVAAPTSTMNLTGLVPNTPYTFRIVPADSLGLLVENSVDRTIMTDNLGTFTSVGPLTIAEGGSLTTALSCSDIEGNIPTISLVTQSDADSGCSLLTAPNRIQCTPNYKTAHAPWASTVAVNCLLNDSSYPQSIAVNVTDVNRAPVLTALTTQTVVAGQAITPVDAADTTDDLDLDADALAYTCTFSGGGFAAGTVCSSLPANSFSFNSSTGVLLWTPSLAAAVGGSTTAYTITIVGSDGQAPPLTDSKSVTINVQGSVVLTTVSSQNIGNNTAIASVDVNNLSSGDDAGMTYSCVYDQVEDAVVGAGTNCNSLPGSVTFNTSTGIFTYTPNQIGKFEIKITGTKAAVSDYKIFTVRSTAVISSVTAPANGTYVASQNLNFLVNFSSSVTVTGTPRLALTVGSATRYANYTSGSGGSTLTFRYVPSAGDSDTDGIAIADNDVQLNSGTLADSATFTPLLTFSSPVLTAVKIDTTGPTISSVAAPADGLYTTLTGMTFQLNFSEAVNISGVPRLVLTIGSTTRYATYASGDGTALISFVYTPTVGDNDSNGISLATTVNLNGGAIVDLPGNVATLTLTAPLLTGVLVDGQGPSITTLTPPADATYFVGQNLDFVATWSENATVTGTPRLALTLGSTTRYANYVSGTGTTSHTFRYTIQSGDTDTDGISINSNLDLNGGTVKDSAVNDATLSFTGPTLTSVLVDTTAPTISSVTGPANGSYKAALNLDFTMLASETVYVVGTPRIALTIGSSAAYATYFSGSASNTLIFRYTVQSGDLDSDGIAAASPLQLNGGTIKDLAGNNITLTYSTPTLTNVWVDGVVPSVTSVTAPANGTFSLGQTLTFTLNMSENVTVTGAPRLVLTVGSSTIYANYTSGTGTSSLVFSYVVQNTDSDSDGIQLATPADLNSGTIRDVALNNASLVLSVPNLTAVRVDALNPYITNVAGPATGTYYGTQTLSFTVNWNEAVTVTGAPRIAFTLGSTTRYANYHSGTGTSTTVFQYTIIRGDLDTDGIVLTAPAQLNSGGIVDAANNSAVLTFTPPDLSAILVDSMLLTTVSDLTYANGQTQLLPGVAMTTIDVNNITTGNDTGITYSCFYDNVVDGSVSGGTNCVSLSGVATFNTSTGVFNYTPSALVAINEIKIRGVKGSDTYDRIFVLETRPAYLTNNLVGSYISSFADTITNGINSPFTSTWKNVATTGAANDASLTNFAQTTASGWTGDGNVLISTAGTGPYRLMFDGVNDTVNLGTGYNAQTSFGFDTWISPTSPTTADAIIIGNKDGADHGFSVSQLANGKLQLGMANSFSTTILSQTPLAYFRLDESAGPTATSIVNGYTATFGSGTTFSQDGILSSNKAVRFDGTNNGTMTIPSGFNLISGDNTHTIEFWLYAGSVANDPLLIDAAQAGAYDFFVELGNNSNTLYVSYGGSYRTYTTAFSLNTWYHIAVVKTGAGDNVSVYKNGILLTVYSGSVGSTPTSSSDLVVGKYRSGSFGFDGRVDELAIYNTALTAGDILNHFNARNATCDGATTLAASTWYHLMGMYNSGTGALSMYLNGALECSITTSSVFSGSSANMTLGSSPTGTNPWSGAISRARIYNSASSSISTTNYAAERDNFSTPVTTAGLLAYFDARRANGTGFPGSGCGYTSWLDLSSTGLIGTLTNFASCDSTTGWNGDGTYAEPYRLNFKNGSTDYVTIPDNASMRLSGDISIVIAVKVSAVGGYQGLVGKGLGAPNYGYLLSFNSGTLNPSLYLDGANTTWNNTATNPVIADTWNVIAVTFKSSTKELKYYMNGVANGDYITSDTTYGTNTHPLEIGTFINNTYPFTGAIAGVMIYNKPLDLSEVKQNCKAFEASLTGLVCAP